MPDTSTIASLVSQMPRPAADGKRGGILDNVDKPALDKALDELVKSGADGVKAIIDMLVEKQPEKDSEARHALNAIVFRVGAPGKESDRKTVALAIAAAIGGGASEKPKEVQAFLIRQLQYVGKGEVAATLGKVLLDAELCDPACAALVAIKEGAGEQLKAALPNATGRCRTAIIQALGQAREASAAAIIRPHLGDADRDTRICAGWALAVAGDAGSVDALIKATGGADAAGNAVGWERIQAVKNCLVLAESLSAAGKKSEAEKIYKHLRDTRTDPKEQYVKDIAVKALGDTN